MNEEQQLILKLIISVTLAAISLGSCLLMVLMWLSLMVSR